MKLDYVIIMLVSLQMTNFAPLLSLDSLLVPPQIGWPNTPTLSAIDLYIQYQQNLFNKRVRITVTQLQ